MLARTVTHALVGLDARRVEVEADLQRGLPGFAIVGMADRACQEAKERSRSFLSEALFGRIPLGVVASSVAEISLDEEP